MNTEDSTKAALVLLGAAMVVSTTTNVLLLIIHPLLLPGIRLVPPPEEANYRKLSLVDFFQIGAILWYALSLLGAVMLNFVSCPVLSFPLCTLYITILMLNWLGLKLPAVVAFGLGYNLVIQSMSYIKVVVVLASVFEVVCVVYYFSYDTAIVAYSNGAEALNWAALYKICFILPSCITCNFLWPRWWDSDGGQLQQQQSQKQPYRNSGAMTSTQQHEALVIVGYSIETVRSSNIAASSAVAFHRGSSNGSSNGSETSADLDFDCEDRITLGRVKDSLFFVWLTPILHVGFTRPLKIEDLTPLPSRLGSTRTFADLSIHAPAGSRRILRSCKLTAQACIAELAAWIPCQALFQQQQKRRDSSFSLHNDLKDQLFSSMNSNSEQYSMPHNQNAQSRSTVQWLERPTASSKHALATLIRFLGHIHGRDFFVLGLLKLAICGASFAGPLLLGAMVAFVSDPTTYPLSYGLALVAVLGLSFILSAMLNVSFNTRNVIVQTALKGAMTRAVFRKAMTLPMYAWSDLETSDSQIMTLIQVDVDRVSSVLRSIHDLWSLPIQVVITCVLLYQQVQAAFLTSVAIIVVMIPVNTVIARRINEATKEMMTHKDKRVKVIAETVQFMRSVKMLGLEPIVHTLSQRHRDQEFLYLSQRKYLDALCVFLWASMPVLVPFCTFSTTVLLGNTLDATKVFTTIALLNMLIFPMNAFPWVVNGFVEASVSATRIVRLLASADGKNLDFGTGSNLGNDGKPVPTANNARTGSSNASNRFPHNDSLAASLPANVKVYNAVHNKSKDDGSIGSTSNAFLESKGLVVFRGDRWTSSLLANAFSNRLSISSASASSDIDGLPADIETDASHDLRLSDHSVNDVSSRFSAISSKTSGSVGFLTSPLAFEGKLGEVHAFIGPIASGKSTLLLGLMDEVFTPQGELKFRTGNAVNAIAYCAQIPPLHSGHSVRENILFGSPLNKQRYKKVVRGMCLDRDFESPAFQDGDRLVISQGGANISGGQRLRIGVARALYSQADLVILDDPFSALDTETSVAVMAFIRLFAVEDRRLVILATHSVRLLSEVTSILRLSEGNVAESGTFGYLFEHSLMFRGLLDSGSSNNLDGSSDCDDGLFRRNESFSSISSMGSTSSSAAAGIAPCHHSHSQQPTQEFNNSALFSAGIPAVATAQTGLLKKLLHQSTLNRGGAAVDISVANLKRTGEVSANNKMIAHFRSTSVTSNAGIAAGMPVGPISGVVRRTSSFSNSSKHSPANSDHDGEEEDDSEDDASSTSSAAESKRLYGKYSAAMAAEVRARTGDSKRSKTQQGRIAILKGSEAKTKNDNDVEEEEEEREILATGRINSTVYKAYLRSMGWGSCLAIVTSTALMQASANGMAFWYAYAVSRDTGTKPLSTGQFLFGTGLIAGFNVLCSLCRSYSFAYGCLEAAKTLYSKLVLSVLGTGVQFFEATSFGKITNRFAKDTNSIDDQLPFMLNIVLAQVFLLLGASIAISITDPLVIIILIIVAIFYYNLQAFYRKSSRELRRLDSAYRSPLYAYINDCINNGVAIRAMKNLSYFEFEMSNALNNTLQVSLTVAVAAQWLNIRLQVFGALIATSLALSATLCSVYFLLPISPGMLGLSLSYSLTIVNNLNGLVGSLTESEQEMISVERVQEYICLPSEFSPTADMSIKNTDHSSGKLDTKKQDDEKANANDDDGEHLGLLEAGKGGPLHRPLVEDRVKGPYNAATTDELSRLSLNVSWRSFHVPCNHCDQAWPIDGHIEFSNLSMRYAEGMPYALNGITLTINPGSRVCVVGRTGSGKSSLMRVLLGMNDYYGSVKIGGMEVREIPKYYLRNRISVIPQDPLLFTESLRYNLDPEGRHSVPELLDALCMCGIDHFLQTVPDFPFQSIERSFRFSKSSTDSSSVLDNGGSTSNNDFTIGIPAAIEPAGDLFSEPEHQEQQRDTEDAVLLQAAVDISNEEALGGDRGRPSDATSSSQGEWKLGSLRQYAMIKSELLDFRIVDAGNNLSQGQKQLICLARAILRKTKVILIDEATASIDPETEAQVYRVLSRLAVDTGATVLCVCHKLDGVEELCNQILELEHGKVVTFQ